MTNSLVEDMARAIRDITGGENYDYMDFCRDAATAALQVLKDRLPKDDRELVERLQATRQRAYDWAVHWEGRAGTGLMTQCGDKLGEAADRIIALSAALEHRKLRIEDADPIVFEGPQP